tara:strand:+ start:486 stop:686 length:201 start_codon:yes stop_codon:yes gene_type:complete
MSKKTDLASTIEVNEWMFIFKALESTRVLGKEVQDFSKLMAKLDLIICDLMPQNNPEGSLTDKIEG